MRIISLIPVLLLLLLATNVYATKFAFDLESGRITKQADYNVPASLVVLASLVGAIVIVLERKKAKGIWFSNSERLR